MFIGSVCRKEAEDKCGREGSPEWMLQFFLQLLHINTVVEIHAHLTFLSGMFSRGEKPE